MLFWFVASLEWIRQVHFRGCPRAPLQTVAPWRGANQNSDCVSLRVWPAVCTLILFHVFESTLKAAQYWALLLPNWPLREDFCEWAMRQVCKYYCNLALNNSPFQSRWSLNDSPSPKTLIPSLRHHVQECEFMFARLWLNSVESRNSWETNMTFLLWCSRWSQAHERKGHQQRFMDDDLEAGDWSVPGSLQPPLTSQLFCSQPFWDVWVLVSCASNILMPRAQRDCDYIYSRACTKTYTYMHAHGHIQIQSPPNFKYKMGPQKYKVFLYI